MFHRARAVVRCGLLAVVPLLLTATVAAGPASAAQYDIKIKVYTGTASGAGTDGNVFVTLFAANGNVTQEYYLDKPGYDDFENGDSDTYEVTSDRYLDRVDRIKVRHTAAGHDQWQLNMIQVDTRHYEDTESFVCDCWFATQSRILNRR